MISRLSFALCFLPVLAIAQEQTLPDWVPAGITLPESFTVIQDMTIGSTHIFIVNVADDPGDLLPEWQAALEEAGYSLDTSMLFEQRLLFSGNGFETAQITTRASDEHSGFDIQIDAKQATE
jgi:hypothetical protein